MRFGVAVTQCQHHRQDGLPCATPGCPDGVERQCQYYVQAVGAGVVGERVFRRRCAYFFDEHGSRWTSWLWEEQEDG